jgi:cobalt-zinc-cadmium efflux system outer membrane protein
VLSERLRAANPQMLVSTTGVRSAEKSRDLAYKSRYPDFMLGISAMQRQNTVNEWSLMLELNLPIRDGVLQSQERESEAMLLGRAIAPAGQQSTRHCRTCRTT